MALAVGVNVGQKVLIVDDETAIRELERLRRSGASFLAFAWPAFWWLDYYSEFSGYLRAKFPCLLENKHLVVFDLRKDNL